MFIGKFYFVVLKCDDKNVEYWVSGLGCLVMCLDLNVEDICILELIEGCFCKDGFVMSDGVCVL